MDEETELEKIKRNLSALGLAWRHDWSDFDGRQLRDQLDDIMAGEDAGVWFYHDHITEQYGDIAGSRCRPEFQCEICGKEEEG